MTATETWNAIAAALVPLADEIEGLQVLGYGYLNGNPSPPTLDVYPGTPFVTSAGMGVGSAQVFFTIRVRVNGDELEAQRLIVRLLDPQDPASVEAAIQDVAVVVENGTTGFQAYSDGNLLGAEWRVSAFL